MGSPNLAAAAHERRAANPVSRRFDVAIVGSGFGGAILAGIAARLGRSVLLVERGAHPRFALGESTTPLANLVLADLARRYEWRELFERTSWGRWRRATPAIPAGLKRGFTFLGHGSGRVPADSPEERLLVAASDRDEVADLQWVRAPLDAWLVAEARRAGVTFLDRTETRLEHLDDGGARLALDRGGEALEAQARFLVDASGADGFLKAEIPIPQGPAPLSTRTVFGHFENVGSLAHRLAVNGHDTARHPYPCESAAVHHIFDGGWMWHLRFDDGRVSAGFVLDERMYPEDAGSSPEREWRDLCRQSPLIAEVFANARPVFPLGRNRALARTAGTAAGAGWALLPHAAYFADPLLSGGIPHTLLAVERLARLLEAWPREDLAGELARYGGEVLAEGKELSRLVAGCYRCFARFDLFSIFVMHYFVAASSLEASRRKKQPDEDAGFLRLRDPEFLSALAEGESDLGAALAGTLSAAELSSRVAARLAPWNREGFCDRAKGNLYPSPVRPAERW